MIKTLVKDIMNKDFPYGVIPSRRIEILTILRKNRISCIPVVSEEKHELRGTISLSDIAKNPDENQIAMLMDREAKKIIQDSKLKELVQALIDSEKNVIPVVDKNNKLKGTATVWDVINKSKKVEEIKDTILDYTKLDITTIYSETPLTTAWEIMRLSKLLALPVINSNGNLEGMVDDSDLMNVGEIIQSKELDANIGSEDSWAWQTSDFLYIIKKTLKLPDKKVKDIMTEEVTSISKSATIAEAAQKMKKHNYQHLPVIDAFGNIIGLIRDYDILKALMKYLEK